MQKNFKNYLRIINQIQKQEQKIIEIGWICYRLDSNIYPTESEENIKRNFQKKIKK